MHHPNVCRCTFRKATRRCLHGEPRTEIEAGRPVRVLQGHPPNRDHEVAVKRSRQKPASASFEPRYGASDDEYVCVR